MVSRRLLVAAKGTREKLARSLSRSRSRSRSERPDGVASIAASSSQTLDAHDSRDAATNDQPPRITIDQPRDATQGRLTDPASSSERDNPDDSTETIETLWNEALRKYKPKDPHDNFLQDIEPKNKQRITDASGSGNDTADLSPPTVSTLVKDVLNEIEQQQLAKNAKKPQWLYPALDVLHKLSGVGDVLVSIDPLHAAPPWAAVKTVLVVLTSKHHLGEKTDQGIALISSLFALCTIYFDLYLAAYLLEAKNLLGGSFFFQKGQAGRQATEPFLKTVAYQLARRFIRWHKHLSDSFQGDRDYIAGSNIHDLFKKLIAEPLAQERRHAAAAGDPMGPVFIVLDALDECIDKDIKVIIKHLAAADIRLFVTARPDTYIHSVLPNGNSKLCTLHHLDQQVVKADIKRYLTHNISQFRNEYNEDHPGKHTILPEGWPHHNALDRLTDAASPLFIVAATMCLMLAEDDWDLSPQAKIQYFLDRQDHGADLCISLYTDILLRSKREGPYGDLKSRGERFRKIVGPVVFLYSPLSLVHLCRLLGLKIDDTVGAIRCYRSVIEIPRDSESDAPVKLLHLSFRDFVLSEHAPQDFRIDERATHSELAQQCLQVLTDQLRRDICGLGSPGTQRADIPATVIHEHISSELQYACRYWAHHLVASDAVVDDSHLVVEVLQDKLLQWIEALSLMGEISEASRQIKHLRTVVRGGSTHIDELLGEAHQFIFDFRQMIHQSPLQVYYSALMFSPPSTMIRKLFDHQSLEDTILERYSVPEWSNVVPVEARIGAKPTSEFGLLSDGRVVAAHQDGTVQVLDPATGAELHSTRLNHPRFSGLARCFPPQTMAMCGNLRLVVKLGRSNVQLWDLKDGSWQDLTSSRDVASVSTDGDQVFVLCQPMSRREDTVSSSSSNGLMDPKLMVFDAATGKQVRDDFVSFASERGATPSSFIISRTSHTGTWTVWSELTQNVMVTWHHGSVQRTRELQRKRVVDLELSPDSKVLGILSEDDVAVWDTETWCLKGTYKFSAPWHGRSLMLSKARIVVFGLASPPFRGDEIEVWDHRWPQSVMLNVPYHDRGYSTSYIALRQGGEELVCLRRWPGSATTEAITLMYNIRDLKPGTMVLENRTYRLQTGFNDALLVAHSHIQRGDRNPLFACEVRNAEGLLTFERRKADIIAVAQGAPFIAVGDRSDDFQVFNGLDGSVISRMKTKFYLRALCFTSDGSRLASLSVIRDDLSFLIGVHESSMSHRPHLIQFAVQLWNVSTGLCEWEKIVETPTLNAFGSYHLAVCSNSMETYVAVACGQRLPFPAPRALGSRADICMMHSSFDGCCYEAAAISILRVQSDTEHKVQTNSVSSIEFSRDGSHLMVRLRQGPRFLIDSTTGEATTHAWSQSQPDATRSKYSAALTRTPSIFEFLTATTQPDGSQLDGSLGISDDGRWIVRDGERMFCIPHMYRATNVAVLGSCVFVTTEHSLMTFKFKPRGGSQASHIG